MIHPTKMDSKQSLNKDTNNTQIPKGISTFEVSAKPMNHTDCKDQSRLTIFLIEHWYETKSGCCDLDQPKDPPKQTKDTIDKTFRKIPGSRTGK